MVPLSESVMTRPLLDGANLAALRAVGIDVSSIESEYDQRVWYHMPSREIGFGEPKPYHPCLRILKVNSNWSQVVPRTSDISNSNQKLRHAPHFHKCFLNKPGELVFLRRTVWDHNFRLSIEQCEEQDETWLAIFWRMLRSSVGLLESK